MAKQQEGKSFVYDLVLAALLREFYLGGTLYLGSDAELKALQAHLGGNEVYTRRCSALITHTTLRNALNAASNQYDAQQLKLTENVEKARQITRYGHLHCTDQEFRLLMAWKNNPITLQRYRLQEGKDSPISKTTRREAIVHKDPVTSSRVTVYSDTTVYSEVQGDYRYEYRVPTTGKNIISVESLTDPTQKLEHSANWEFGVDKRHVADMVNMLPVLQAHCDELEARDNTANRLDFGMLMGFRLEKMTADEIFPGVNLPAKLTKNRFYRIVTATRQNNLFMVLSAYLPFLTAGQKKDIENTLSKSQQDWYQEATDEYENTQSSPGTLAVLDSAIRAVLETRDHFNAPDTVPDMDNDSSVGNTVEEAPDFWYEFRYTKWAWTKDKDGRFTLAQVDSTDADGNPRIFQMLPYQIVSSEGRIYLVGLRLDMSDARNRDAENDQWMLSNLRIDRIRDLRRVTAETGHPLHKDKSIHELADYYGDIQATAATNMEYRNNSPKMFSGTPEPWELDCSPAITNVLVDTFGANALVFRKQVPAPLPLDRPPDYDEADAAPRPAWNRVQVEACWDGIRLFLLQNLDNVKLADTPKQAAARRSLCNLFYNAMENYDKL